MIGMTRYHSLKQNEKTPHSIVVHVQIPCKTVNLVDSIAQAESRTRSNVIRLALDAFIQSKGIAE